MQSAVRDSCIQSCLLFLDIEKAFDSVEMIYFLQVLKKMNLCSLFCKAIQSIYLCPISQLNIEISSSVSLMRGTYQGCTCSVKHIQRCFQPGRSVLLFKLWRLFHINIFQILFNKNQLLEKTVLDNKYGIVLPWLEYKQIYNFITFAISDFTFEFN